MKKKKVVQLNSQGYFCGLSDAYESPLEPGVFLLPANSVEIAPPVIPDGYTAQLVNKEWVLEEIPKPDPEPEPKEITYADQRLLAYPPIVEYLDGIVKGDKSQIDGYIAKCLAVKAKYPKA